jgi:hypothetical protein
MRTVLPAVLALVLVGCCSSINSPIRLAPGSVSGQWSRSVNGDIHAGSGCSLPGARTVNGAIRIGNQCRIAEDLESVNGDVTCGEGTVVAGSIRTVNGRVDLQGTRVEHRLSTYNGDLHLAGTKVAGGIRIKAPRHQGDGGPNGPLIIELRAGSEVQGGIDIEPEARQVEVHLSADSHILGPVGRARIIAQ